MPTTRVPWPALLMTAATAFLSTAAAWAQAQPGAPGPPAIDQQVVNERPKFFVRASVDRKHRIYADGDSLRLNVRCEEDAFLYVLYQQADGVVYQIFPNSGQRDNRVKAMTDLQVPAPDDAFRWVVGAPFGTEVIKVIASKKPVDVLSLPGLREGRFNPVTIVQMDGVGQQMGKEPRNVWSEHDLKITTVRQGEPTEPPAAAKRVGVFFGTSEYLYNDIALKLTDGKHGLNLPLPQQDARSMAHAMQSVGQLSEARVFLNKEVTRDKVREVLTEWLPSVTKPGDTVFFFYVGHGDQIVDDDNDEKDGLDETIATTELMSIGILGELFEQDQAGKLDPALSQTVKRLFHDAVELYRSELAGAGGKDAPGAQAKANDKVHAFLARETSVSDDELGHWMQKLDGRHVVVLCDTCFSGGLFPTGGPGTKELVERRPRAARFDFLSGEFARLKDLNQPSLTVLSAASENESSAELSGDDNCLFTGAMLKAMKTDEPVDMQRLHTATVAEIAGRIGQINGARSRLNQTLPDDKKLKPMDVFTPSFFTTEQKPVYVKPAPPSGTDPANQE